MSAVIAACALVPVGAREALGDLDVRVRVIELAVDAGETRGVVRLQVTVESFSPVEDVAVELRRSDGTPWMPAAVAIDPGAVSWYRRDSSVPAAVGAGFDLSSRDRLTAEVSVPLDRAGLYEIVARASGRVGERAVRAEGLTLVPLGVEIPKPVPFEGAVEFRAVPGSEVQP